MRDGTLPRWREGARGIAASGGMGRAPPSEGHGIRRVATVLRSRFRRDSVLPSSMRVLEHPLSPSPGALRGWSPGSPACDDRDHLLSRVPAKGPGRLTTRVLGSLRRFMNRARDRSRCSSDRSEGHGAREAGFAIRQTSAFSTTGTRPNLTGEARLLWLGRCPRESFSRSPEFQGRLSPTPRSVKRESGPTAAPENDHCDSFQPAD